MNRKQATARRANARKHGLATPISAVSGFSEELGQTRTALAGPHAGPRVWEAADRIARSFLELRRIQEIKNALTDHYSMKSPPGSQPQQFSSAEQTNDFSRTRHAFAYSEAQSQLESIHRYERRAHSQFRRGMREYTYAREQETRLKDISLNKQFGVKDDQ